MKKRVFIGIKAESNLINEIEEWKNKYQNKLNVRWIEKENLHITLVPPWYEEDLEKVIAGIDQIRALINPFEILFNEVCYGPDYKRPRLIWAKGETSETITKLKKSIEESISIKPENRDFKVHLTLARFKGSDFRSFVIKRIEDRVFWKIKVDTFCLFESLLSPFGAKYIVLKRFELKNLL